MLATNGGTDLVGLGRNRLVIVLFGIIYEYTSYDKPGMGEERNNVV